MKHRPPYVMKHRPPCVMKHRRPRVAILATGDELADAGAPLGPGQIRNSNSPMIATMTLRAGGRPYRFASKPSVAGSNS